MTHSTRIPVSELALEVHSNVESPPTLVLDLTTPAKLARFENAMAIAYGAKPAAALRLEGNTAIVCAWCPSKEQADLWCKARGHLVSHGMCDACAEKAKKELESS